MYYSSLKLTSYNAIFNFVIGARNIGKTWAFKIRALKRFIKNGTTTKWIRRFTKECQKTINNFYSAKMLNLIKVPIEKIKYQGLKIFYDISKDSKVKKWICFLEIIPLNAQQQYKSLEDTTTDTIVFDEFTTTQTKLNQYKGNEVVDFLDLFSTVSREKQVKVFFLGNKETYTNPYFNFLGIKVPSIDFEGIKTFKKGTIAYQQINDYLYRYNSYENKVGDLLHNTSYENYLYNGKPKTALNIEIKKLPKTSTRYLQFENNKGNVTFWKNQNNFYIKSGINIQDYIFTDKMKHENKKQYIVLSCVDKKKMLPLYYAYKLNQIFICDYPSYDILLDFLLLLNF